MLCTVSYTNEECVKLKGHDIQVLRINAGDTSQRDAQLPTSNSSMLSHMGRRIQGIRRIVL